MLFQIESNINKFKDIVYIITQIHQPSQTISLIFMNYVRVNKSDHAIYTGTDDMEEPTLCPTLCQIVNDTHLNSINNIKLLIYAFQPTIVQVQ